MRFLWLCIIHINKKKNKLTCIRYAATPVRTGVYTEFKTKKGWMTMSVPVLRVRDKDGNVSSIPAIKGNPGKSAYEYAKDGGYTGTEEEFAEQLANVSSGGSGTKFIVSNPNLLINGDFQVWQRGTSFDLKTNGAYKYTADRWCVATSNSHHIEKASSGGIALACSLYQHLETPLTKGHNYVLSANIDGTVYTLDIVGGTSASNDYLKYNFSSSKETVQIVANSNGQTIEWVKLEKGSVATPFIPRLYAEELNLCKRYYQVLETIGVRGYSYPNSGGYSYQLGYEFDEMRIPPTVEFIKYGYLTSSDSYIEQEGVYNDVGKYTTRHTFRTNLFTSAINSNSYFVGILVRLDAEIY